MTELKKGGSLTSRVVERHKLNPPQVSAGLTVLKRAVDVDPVDPDVAKLVSKSRAQKFLRQVFNEARFQTVQTAGGPVVSIHGIETWQLWCKGSYGRMVAIVEVTAPRHLLPYSVAREALKRLNQGLRVDATTMAAYALPEPAPAEASQAPAPVVP
jgi:hypothetical protein